MQTAKPLSPFVLLAGLGLVAALSAALAAFHEVDEKLHSGLFGINRDQTAQVHVVHVIDPNQMPAACDFEVTVLDAANTILQTSRASLEAGQSASFPFADPSLHPGSRKLIRVEIVGFNPQPDPPGCLASFEVFHTRSGETLFIGDPNEIPAPIAPR